MNKGQVVKHIDDVYERPDRAKIAIDTAKLSVDESVKKVMEHL